MTSVPGNPIGHPITEDDIANYLANTPDFFERHAELLAAVQLTSPHSKRTVSLQERQAEMLREKIKAIEHRMMEMIRNGNENTMLSDKLLAWTRSLFLVTEPFALPDLVALEIREQFLVPQVAIKVWDVAPENSGCDFAKGVSDDARLFASSLTEPFCGLNTGFECANWLADPQTAISVALLPLRAARAAPTAPAFGMLVLASSDAQRFNSGMGTDFLERIAEIASAALSRLR
jgi:uncharacterized protein YigA (DUF484 family)